ncbi:ribonuclease H-like domain-containing protein [Tanacetum coccineum]
MRRASRRFWCLIPFASKKRLRKESQLDVHILLRNDLATIDEDSEIYHDKNIKAEKPRKRAKMGKKMKKEETGRVFKTQFSLKSSYALFLDRMTSSRSFGETAWIRNLLRELHSPLLTATLVYCDNVSAVYMSANPVQHQRTKHIEIDIHFVRDMVKAGHVRVLHVPSRFQYADIFTKGLPSALFEDFRSSLSVQPPPAPTAGAY